MQKDMKISIYEVVGSPLCVASNDGQKVYDRLAAALRAECRVALSFHNVTTMTSAFMNSAIGQLYGAFSEEQIRALLRVEDMEPDDLELLKRVIDTAKLYFQNRKNFDQAIREELEDEDGDV